MQHIYMHNRALFWLDPFRNKALFSYMYVYVDIYIRNVHAHMRNRAIFLLDLFRNIALFW